MDNKETGESSMNSDIYTNGGNITKQEHDAKGNDEIEEWERKHLRYGWRGWTPRCLQVFNSIRWFVFWTCVFSLFQGFIVNGVINAIISTLEKRFELPSSKSGLIASSNDFFAFFLVLAISYLGGDRHKPKIIAVGILVLGVGSFVFSLPHFLTAVYTVGSSDMSAFENVCNDVNDTSSDKMPMVEQTSNLQNYLYLLMLGNALHGAGSTPIFILGTTFIDENTKAEMTSLYLGIIYCAASLGVAAGYMLGGQTLNIFTDFNEVNTNELDLTPMDPRWVGAWWISFLITGSVMFIICIPMAAYPKRLPGSAKLQAERKSEAYKSNQKRSNSDSKKNLKDFPLAIWQLIKNPTFLFLALSTCMEGLIVSGIAAFGAKFMEVKFNLPAAFAGFIMGIITVPGAGGGMLLGGYLVKRFKLKCRGIVRLNLVIAIIALVMGCLFLIQCPIQNIAGVTVSYYTQSKHTGEPELTSMCNADCGCSAIMYDPVCGMDGSIYFTPCHAGCNLDYDWMEGPMGPFKMYKNCSCIASSMLYKMSKLSNNSIPLSDVTTTPYTAVATDVNLTNFNFGNTTNMTGPPIGAFQGICMSDCKLMYVVAPLLFIGMLMTFTTVSPSQTATLRCVPEDQRSLAVGMQWLFLRLLGTTPGPVLLGNIIDSACNVWQDVNEEEGSCWIYKKTDMGIKIFVWWCVVKGFSIAFYFCAQRFYKTSDESDNESDENKPMHPVELLDTKETVI